MGQLVDIDKLKGIVNNNNRNTFLYIIAGGALIIFLIIGFTVGTYHPDPNSKIVKELVDKQIADEKSKYEQTIKDKDIQIKNIQDQLDRSSKATEIYRKENAKLKEQVGKIQKPKTDTETRKRLKEMGYETF